MVILSVRFYNDTDTVSLVKVSGAANNRASIIMLLRRSGEIGFVYA